MKHAICFVLIVLFSLSFMLGAAADVIWEPENNFYERHAEECVYHGNRGYKINGESGYAYQYKEPGSDVQSHVLANGETIYISHTYTDKDGNVWGLPQDGSGWFCMSDLALIYDSTQFSEDHAAQITADAGEFADAVWDASLKVALWNYPGGQKLENRADADIMNYPSAFYRDDEGRVWGAVSYYRGTRGVWICLSDPEGKVTAENPTVAVVGQLIPPADVTDVPVNGNSRALIFAVAGAIVCLVAVTLILFRVFNRKKEN